MRGPRRSVAPRISRRIVATAVVAAIVIVEPFSPARAYADPATGLGAFETTSTGAITGDRAGRHLCRRVNMALGGAGASSAAIGATGGGGAIPISGGVGGGGIGIDAPSGHGSMNLDVVPCLYNLALTKTPSVTSVNAGGKITWTLGVTNNGPDPMTRGDILTLADTLPPGSNATSPSPSNVVTSIAVSGGSGGSNTNLTSGIPANSAAFGVTTLSTAV